MLNGPLTSFGSRRALCVENDKKIVRIDPNAITWVTENDDEFTTEFRADWKYSKRLYFAFEPLWWMMHSFDWAVADRWVPQLSFGFDSLTAYPDPVNGPNTMTGSARRTANENWATLRAGAGNAVYQSDFFDSMSVQVAGNAGTDAFTNIGRGITLFDTSNLTSNASISAAVLSLWNLGTGDGYTPSSSIDIYTSNPASNATVANADYGTLGDTSQTGGSPVTLATMGATAQYFDWTFDSTGRGNISKTGISKFGIRFTSDGSNSAPTSGNVVAYFNPQSSNYTGNSQDPKLVVTYTIAGYVPGSLVGKIPTFLQV